jgi:hypothetical protein
VYIDRTLLFIYLFVIYVVYKASFFFAMYRLICTCTLDGLCYSFLGLLLLLFSCDPFIWFQISSGGDPTAGAQLCKHTLYIDVLYEGIHTGSESNPSNKNVERNSVFFSFLIGNFKNQWMKWEKNIFFFKFPAFIYFFKFPVWLARG